MVGEEALLDALNGQASTSGARAAARYFRAHPAVRSEGSDG
ncbi:hypothetical protein ACP70R_000676 [Stipagrostis hirtigluma subsp. patula]